MTKFREFKDWLTQVSFLIPIDCALFEPSLQTKTLKEKTIFYQKEKSVKKLDL